MKIILTGAIALACLTTLCVQASHCAVPFQLQPFESNSLSVMSGAILGWNYQDLKDIAAAIQSMVTSLAIVVGAIWTYYTFRRLGAVNKARAEIQKIELENNVEPAINAKIEATQLDLGDKKLYVSVVVRLANVGAKKIRLSYQEWDPAAAAEQGSRKEQGPRPLSQSVNYLSPITVSRFTGFNQNGLETYDAPIKGSPLREDDLSTPVRAETIRAQSTVFYSVLVQVPKAGLYRIAFASYIYAEDTDLPVALKPFYGYSNLFLVRDAAQPEDRRAEVHATAGGGRTA